MWLVRIHVPSRIENFHSERRGWKVLHAVNLAFLPNLFEASQLADLSGTSMLENSLKIVTPKLKILEANYSHELEVDNRARLDLAKLANLTKEDEQAYPSLAHSMVHSWQEYSSGSYDLSFSLVSWRSWILVILGLLAGASFGLSVILSYRLRILAATVTTFSLPRHSHALPTILNYFPSTTPALDTQKFFVFEQIHVDWTLDTAVVLLLVLIGFMTILKICRCCEKRRYEFKLYAQIGYQNRCVQICIETFKLQPENYQFSSSKYVESLRVTGCFLPHLKINWPTLHIYSTITNENYHLLNSVSLTWSQARFLRSVLRKPYWCIFVTKVGETHSILSLPVRRWDSAPSYGHINEGMSMLNVSAPALYPSLGEAETKFWMTNTDFVQRFMFCLPVLVLRIIMLVDVWHCLHFSLTFIAVDITYWCLALVSFNDVECFYGTLYFV